MSLSHPFCPQSRPDSCVAACCAMLLHRRAPPPSESIDETHDRLHNEFASPSLPTLGDMARRIGANFESVDSVADASFALLEAFVGMTWCAVVVMGGPWTHDLRRHRRLRELHGRLSHEPGSALPRHAVVLTSWEPHRVSIHDPWFHMLDQPIRIEAAWLRRAWTGEFAYLPPSE